MFALCEENSRTSSDIHRLMPVPADRPLCKCHGEPMYPNGEKYGRQTFTCVVRKRERERARYHADMRTFEGKARRNAKSRAQHHRRKDDPLYRMRKQIHDFTRFRLI